MRENMYCAKMSTFTVLKDAVLDKDLVQSPYTVSSSSTCSWSTLFLVCKQASPTANLPLRTAAVWSGAAQASHWAAEGAWGNPQNRTSAGFWDDAIGGASTKKAAPSTNRYGVNKTFYFSMCKIQVAFRRTLFL